MRAAFFWARIVRNVSSLIPWLIAIFVAGTAAKGEERLPFLGALTHPRMWRQNKTLERVSRHEGQTAQTRSCRSHLKAGFSAS